MQLNFLESDDQHSPHGDASPLLCDLPDQAAHRLIDNGTMHYEASVAGFAERYRRGETPHTIHVWWARRPHSAMRSLVYACLSKTASDDAATIMKKLTYYLAAPSSLINTARTSLRKQYAGKCPRVLDMFGGGGTIPFEAANLGAETYSVDSNQLSVFLQKSLLEYPHLLKSGGLMKQIEESGRRVLNQLEVESTPLFPLRGYVFTYLWTYSTKCTSCGYRFLLSKRPWLSRKNGKRIALKVGSGKDKDTPLICEVSDDYEHRSVWIGRRGEVACPRCHHTQNGISVKECTDELVATIGAAAKTGKAISAEVEAAVPAQAVIDTIEKTALDNLGATLPTSPLPRWSGIVNPALYGIETHADVFNRRQRAVALLLLKALTAEFEHIRGTGGVELAQAVIGLLSGLIDQHVDWNCRLSMWISQNEQVGRAFCGPGVAMLWDYAETDPVSSGPSNLWSKLNRIIAGVKSISTLSGVCCVHRGIAQALPFSNAFFDAIVTDPPYYDNIYYNVLADFFFAWKRLVLAAIEPGLFSDNATDWSRELVASTFRNGDAKSAHDKYCEEFSKAISEAERVLKRDGVFALLYSHGSLEGWEALALGYRRSAFHITSVQPLSIERKQRPRAMTSEAVNTCVVFVAHKGTEQKPVGSVMDMCHRLRECGQIFETNLGNAGWNREDIAVATFAQSVGMLANVSSVRKWSDLEALEKFAAVVRERFPSFGVKSRKSL